MKGSWFSLKLAIVIDLHIKLQADLAVSQKKKKNSYIIVISSLLSNVISSLLSNENAVAKISLYIPHCDAIPRCHFSYKTSGINLFKILKYIIHEILQWMKSCSIEKEWCLCSSQTHFLSAIEHIVTIYYTWSCPIDTVIKTSLKIKYKTLKACINFILIDIVYVF